LPARAASVVPLAAGWSGLASAWRIASRDAVPRLLIDVDQAASAALLGFAWAAQVANLRRRDELSLADEGGEVGVSGAVASLAAQL